jgi:hypothetical protein
MLKHRINLPLWSILFVVASVAPGVAQQGPPRAETSLGMQCGGEYECVEDRPLTEAEARASRNHPEYTRTEDTEKVLLTPSVTTCTDCQKAAGR